jgi:hypothetical protein
MEGIVMPTTPSVVRVLFLPSFRLPEVEIDAPSWGDIEAAIRALDGKTKNQVFLIVEEETHLMGIGGGEGGIYTCDAQLPDGRYMLTDPSKSDSETVSVSDGQAVDYVKSHTAELDMVLDAARWFFEHGTTSPSQSWVSY